MKRTILAILYLAGSSFAMAADPETPTVPVETSLKILTSNKDGVPDTIMSPLGKKMSLKFDDEFNAVVDKDGQPYLDRTKWRTTFWQGSSERTSAGNGEAQYYMDKDYAGKDPNVQRFNPFSFEEPGILTISATKVPKEFWGNYWMGEQRCFCSGLIITDPLFTFQYGYVEGRFKLPSNCGTWPAFWLLPDDPKLGEDPPKRHPWPPEFDIFEYFGHRPTKFTTGYIQPKNEKEKTNISRWMQIFDFDVSKDFHVWGLEWDENTVVWLFDGKEVARGNITEGFRKPFYILVNLAVGGNWYSQEMKAANTPSKAWEVDESTMPWKMKCDYIRVYQVQQ